MTPNSTATCSPAEFRHKDCWAGLVDSARRDSTCCQNGASESPPKWSTPMRFMVIVKATKDSEAGILPSNELLTEMGKYNEELVKAGVMLAGEGLQASSKGARVRFNGNKRTVVDG